MDFVQAVLDAPDGATVRFAAGTYDTGGRTLAISQAGLTLRSASDDRDSVVVDGGYAGGSIVEVYASDVTIAHLTLQRAWYHPIHVHGTSGENTDRVRIHDVVVRDPGQQGIKVNADGGFTGFADSGEIACSLVELTDTGRANVRDSCYTGGIDVHAGRDWHVHDNEIRGFWCNSGLSEHAIHFWRGSRDTLIERNSLSDNARGIGLGLGDSASGSSRTYSDAPCGSGYVGHYGGVVRNNMIFGGDADLWASAYRFDTGVGLEQACGAAVVHNTVFTTESPASSSIEWRFSNSDPLVANNLVSARLLERDGATATLQGNVEGATEGQFVDANNGNLHLDDTATVIDLGVRLASGVCDDDFDREERGSAADVGADEVPE
jgi:hypothetical protein